MPNLWYGIHLPHDNVYNIAANDDELVLTDKTETMKLLKKYKKARFKVFRTKQEAENFSINGIDNSTSDECFAANEKMSAFPAPKPQDFVRFRKLVEAGDLAAVKKLVNENPRYLISNGDTPAILQEGSRYNALHVAAKSNKAEIADYLLSKVSDHNFISKLYREVSDEDQNTYLDRSKILLDLYLNTPEKSLNETPLHFAVKVGALEVVKVLLSYSQCDRLRLNKFRQSPADIVCTRANMKDASLKSSILEILQEQYYVPVLRSEDLSWHAVVGEPFQAGSSPITSCSNITSPVEVKAVAGPMEQNKAYTFRKLWKTPPRNRHSILKRPTLNDPDKGLETIGRNLAYENRIQWTEYWSFLDAFVDLRSQIGLNMLETFLKNLRNKVAQTEGPMTYSNDMKLDIKAIGKSTRSDKDTNSVPLCVKSPVSELCDAFKHMSLVNDESNDHCKYQGEGNNNYGGTYKEDILQNKSYLRHITQTEMEQFCQQFARRLADVLKLGSVSGTIRELDHIQHFLCGCSEDQKFTSINLDAMHSEISKLCYKRFVSEYDKGQVINFIQSLICKDDPLIKPTNISPVQSCADYRICLLKNLSCSFKNEGDIPKTSCSCLVNYHSPRSRRGYIRGTRRTLFSSGQDRSKKHSRNRNEAGGNGSNPEENTEFNTPPSSPTNCSSDDDDFEDPQEIPDVFLTGNKPTKLDLSVLEAIRPVDITNENYPNIYLWKHLCQVYSSTVKKQDSWPSPVTPIKKLQRERITSTPSWHRSKLISSNIL